MHAITASVMLYMIGSGVALGLWPIVMRQAGLDGLVSVMVVNVTALCLLGVYITVVEAHSAVEALAVSSWTTYLWLLTAGLCVGLGLIFLMKGFDLVSVQHMGLPFAIMIAVQLMVPVGYHAMYNGVNTDFWVGLIALAVLVVAWGPRAA